jgi:hypothetical protein
MLTIENKYLSSEQSKLLKDIINKYQILKQKRKLKNLQLILF